MLHQFDIFGRKIMVREERETGRRRLEREAIPQSKGFLPSAVCGLCALPPVPIDASNVKNKNCKKPISMSTKYSTSRLHRRRAILSCILPILSSESKSAPELRTVQVGQVLFRFPDSYYVKWLNLSLFHTLWNLIYKRLVRPSVGPSVGLSTAYLPLPTFHCPPPPSLPTPSTPLSRIRRC